MTGTPNTQWSSPFEMVTSTATSVAALSSCYAPSSNLPRDGRPRRHQQPPKRRKGRQKSHGNYLSQRERRSTWLKSQKLSLSQLLRRFHLHHRLHSLGRPPTAPPRWRRRRAVSASCWPQSWLLITLLSSSTITRTSTPPSVTFASFLRTDFRGASSPGRASPGPTAPSQIRTSRMAQRSLRHGGVLYLRDSHHRQNHHRNHKAPAELPESNSVHRMGPKALLSQAYNDPSLNGCDFHR